MAAGTARSAGTNAKLNQLPSEQYFLEQMPVVLSATRLAQPKDDAPAAVTIIDHHMIEASGATNIPDLFRLAPGFQVAYASGNQPVVTYHGMSDEYAKRMQVLVDGRSVYDPVNGGVDWTDLPVAIENIDHIEVIRGPNGAAYGSNAFLGAINIVTRDPSRDRGTFLRAAAGNDDFRKAVMRHGGTLGRMSYRVTLGYRQDDGLPTRYDYRRISLATFRGDYHFSPTDSLDITTGYAGGPHGAGVSATDDLLPLHDSQVHEHFEQLRWHHISADGGEYSLQFYHNYRRRSEYAQQPMLASTELGIPPALFQSLTGEPDQHLPLDYSTLEHRYELEFQHRFRINGTTRVVWGSSVRLDQGGGPQWFFNRTDLIDAHLYRLFGNVEWHPRKKLVLNLGAMVEKSSLTSTSVSPRAALNYHIRPTQTLRASVSRAYRLPTLYEDFAHAGLITQGGTPLYVRFIGPGNLKPERITSYELGYLGTAERYGLSLDAEAYHHVVQDRIATVDYKQYPEPFGATSNGLVFSNSRGLIINGAELSLRYQPSRKSMVLVNYAYAHADGNVLNSIDPPKPPEYRDRSNTVPTHTESVLVIRRLPHQLEASAMYYRVSAMRWLGNGDALGPQDRLDLRLAKNFHVGNTYSRISIVLQNAIHDYTEFRTANVFKHRLYAQLNVNLP
ncbi:MAG: TonB-dependent receptor [Gammaproteobacteria bacterium]